MTTLDVDFVPQFLDLLRLEDKRFLVAGGGRGMGRQVVHALSQAGARVVCFDADAESVNQTAKEVGGIAVTGDALQRVDVAAAVDLAVAELGGLDGVVDVIGMAAWAELFDTSDETWQWSLDMGARHAYLLLQLAGPVIERSGGGAFAFVGSISGISSAPGHGAYGAGKAALLSLVRTAAVELAHRNIRVNAVVPGSVATHRALASHVEKGTVPDLSRYARAYDIAAALLFLVSPMAQSVTGQTITVDHGLMVKYPIDLWSPPESTE